MSIGCARGVRHRVVDAYPYKGTGEYAGIEQVFELAVRGSRTSVRFVRRVERFEFMFEGGALVGVGATAYDFFLKSPTFKHPYPGIFWSPILCYH